MSEKLYESFDKVMNELFQERPDAADAYLTLAFEEYEQDSNMASLLISIRRVVEAKEGIPTLATKIGIPKQSLYKALAPTGNPKLSTIHKVIKALGYQISLIPLEPSSKKQQPSAEASFTGSLAR